MQTTFSVLFTERKDLDWLRVTKKKISSSSFIFQLKKWKRDCFFGIKITHSVSLFKMTTAPNFDTNSFGGLCVIFLNFFFVVFSFQRSYEFLEKNKEVDTIFALFSIYIYFLRFIWFSIPNVFFFSQPKMKRNIFILYNS